MTSAAALPWPSANCWDSADIMDQWLPYQRQWLQDRSPLKLCLKSRRIGMTFTTTHGLCLEAMERPGLDVNVFSRDEDLAADVITYARPWVKMFNIVADEQIIADGNIHAWQIAFPNGSRLRTWSSAPDRAVGKGGVVVLDEFQSHTQAEKLWSYVAPVKMWGGSISVVGTMRRPSLFSDFVDDAKAENKAGWSFHQITLSDALRQGLLAKVNEVRRNRGWHEWANEAAFIKDCRQGLTDAQFRQEYYCEAVEETYRVFAETLVERQSMYPAQLYCQPVSKSGLTFMGWDVGRIHDHAVLAILERVGDKLYTRHLATFVNRPFAEQRQEFAAAVHAWSPEKIVIDTSTLGIDFGEWAVMNWGEARVIPATMVGLAREKVLCHAVASMGMGELVIPRIPELMKQFTRIYKKITIENQVRYVVPVGATGHCDEAMAIMLAAYGCSGNPTEIMAERLRRPEEQHQARRDRRERPES
jgi:phage FluMu gp28-like protein